jgi:lysophospholipase L1-like esterase
VNVTGADRLKLVVTDAGDGNGWDHADWADATLVPVDPNFTLNKIKILCVGNSITEGWGLPDPATQCYPALLQGLLGSRFEVINSGLSGRTLLKNGDVPYWK